MDIRPRPGMLLRDNSTIPQLRPVSQEPIFLQRVGSS